MAKPRKNQQQHRGKQTKAAKNTAKTSERSQKPVPYKEGTKSHQTKKTSRNIASGDMITPLSPKHIFLYGRHAVQAALNNKSRNCHRLILTVKTKDALAPLPEHQKNIRLDICDRSVLDNSFAGDAPHQEIILEASPLSPPHLEKLPPNEHKKSVILMLDQVTDPHNIGACLRSAAALGATALITQDRHSPQEGAVLAKAASGGLETVPWIRASNLSQTLDTLKEQGYWAIGLDGTADQDIGTQDLGDKIILVMGSEGRGIRPLVMRHCDHMVKIPMTGLVESLNVSNAAAIGLYVLTK